MTNQIIHFVDISRMTTRPKVSLDNYFMCNMIEVTCNLFLWRLNKWVFNVNVLDIFLTYILLLISANSPLVQINPPTRDFLFVLNKDEGVSDLFDFCS